MRPWIAYTLVRVGLFAVFFAVLYVLGLEWWLAALIAAVLGFESENLGWYTASHYEILLPLVLSGDTVLLAPTFVVQPYLEAREMVILDIEWRHEAKVHFAATRAASFSPIVREIREYGRAIGEKLRDDWRGVADQFATQ